MNVLVTGGAGFIGSHLSIRLLQEGHEVCVVDCLHPYYSVERKKWQLKRIKDYGPVQFINHNLLNKDATEQLFQKIRPDAVVHLAALPGVAYSLENPLEYVDYDIKATINVLEAAGKAGCAHVLFASSSSVYGNQSGPCDENMANGKVISPYAAAKFSAEAFCHVYASLYGFKVHIMRFFTVYGPWGRPDMAIGIFLKSLIQQQPITLLGQNRERDFTYIDDIVNGIMRILEKAPESGVLNIGSNKPVSMMELLSELKVYFPHMELKTKAARAGDVTHTWANIEKAQKLIGYEPAVEFKEGLAKTVQWALQHEQVL